MTLTSHLPPAAFTILTPDGDPVHSKNLIAAAYAEFQKIPETEFQLGRGEKRIVFTSPGLLMRDDTTGVVHPVVRAFAVVQYEVSEDFIPFNLVSYTNSPNAQQVMYASFADIDLGRIKGKMMIVYKEEEGEHVVFIP